MDKKKPFEMDKRQPADSKHPGPMLISSRPRRLSFRLVRLILGLVLAAAGAIKLYELGFEAQDEGISTLLLMAFAECELLGGLWMFSGIYPERTQRWPAAAFAGLAV